MKRSKGDMIFDGAVTLLMIILLFIYIYPLLFVISASVSDPNAVLRGEMWLLPKGFTLEGYKHILQYKEIWRGYYNSLIIILISVPLALFLTFTAGYVLSRRDFMPRKLVTPFFIFTMFFSGGLIPTYLLVQKMNMLNTIWAVTIPNALTMYYVIIVRTYYDSNIPEEMREAANMDGCSDFRFFISVVLPLSTPVFAVMTLFYAVDRWNMYFRPLIYLSSRELYPLQLILREIIFSSNMTAEMLEGFSPSEYAILLQLTNIMKYGVIVVASLPVLILYPFVQRFFIKGIMVGAVKG